MTAGSVADIKGPKLSDTNLTVVDKSTLKSGDNAGIRGLGSITYY